MSGRTNNAFSTRRSEHPHGARDFPLRPGEEPPLGSHLTTPRALYTHHGIYIGNGHVIHYAGLAHGLRRGPVEDVPLERFAHGHSIRVRYDLRRFDPATVVERARSRLGESRYRILTNNCEHLCAWALRNEPRSMQVDRIRSAPRVTWHAITQIVARLRPPRIQRPVFI
jgi:Lecithin retinol acyltransferase